MQITRSPIISGAHVNDKRIWLDLSCSTDSTLTFGACNIQGAALPIADQQHNVAQLIKDAQQVKPIRSGSTRIAIMLTLDYKTIAQWECDLAGDYLAHLGIYDVAADQLDLIEFVDEMTGATTHATAIAKQATMISNLEVA